MDGGNLIGIIVALVLVALVLGFVLGRRGRDSRDLSGPPSSGSYPMAESPQPRATASIDLAGAIGTAGEIDAATLAKIAAAMDAGMKIEAIKLLREATGMGLKESKDAVEALFEAAGR